MKRIPFDPPIDPKLNCRNCGDPLIAAALIIDGGLQIQGLRQYEWTHAHGSPICRPTTSASPFDGWQATAAVKAVLADRQAAEDALLDALDAEQ